jgi:hypothetical protein
VIDRHPPHPTGVGALPAVGTTRPSVPVNKCITWQSNLNAFALRTVIRSLMGGSSLYLPRAGLGVTRVASTIVDNKA